MSNVTKLCVVFKCFNGTACLCMNLAVQTSKNACFFNMSAIHLHKDYRTDS